MTQLALERLLADARLAPTPARLEALLRALERRGCPLAAPARSGGEPDVGGLPELRVVEAVLDVVRGRDVVVRLRRDDGGVQVLLASGAELQLSLDEGAAWRIDVCRDETGAQVWSTGQASPLAVVIDGLACAIGQLPVWRALDPDAPERGPSLRPTPQLVEALRRADGREPSRLCEPERLIDVLRHACVSVLPAEPLVEREVLAGDLLDAIVDLARGRSQVVALEGEEYGAIVVLDDGRRLMGCVGYAGDLEEIFGLLFDDDTELCVDGSVDVATAPVEWSGFRLAWSLAQAGTWVDLLPARDDPDDDDQVARPPVALDTVGPAPAPAASSSASLTSPDALAALRARLDREYTAPPTATTAGPQHASGMAAFWLAVMAVAIAFLLVLASGGGAPSYGGYRYTPPQIQVPRFEPMPPLDLNLYDEGQIARLQASLANLGGTIDAQGRIVWSRSPAEALVEGALAGSPAPVCTGSCLDGPDEAPLLDTGGTRRGGGP